ncbi:hypothetical protein TNCV_4250881 [Trichonephila clavipes]|nr:hypothetical protein TNCV_4250881 [Trichonephila clavipes]
MQIIIVTSSEGYPVCPCGGQNHGSLQSLLTVPVYPFGTWGGRPGNQRAQKVLDKLDFTTFCGYKFRSSSAKGARRSSSPRAPNELKSALALQKECEVISFRTTL